MKGFTVIDLLLRSSFNILCGQVPSTAQGFKSTKEEPTDPSDFRARFKILTSEN